MPICPEFSKVICRFPSCGMPPKVVAEIKVAPTVVEVFMVTRHVPAPEQAPDHPVNVEPASGVAVSVTGVPGVKDTTQLDPPVPQRTLPTLLDMVPDPELSGRVNGKCFPVYRQINVNIGAGYVGSGNVKIRLHSFHLSGSSGSTVKLIVPVFVPVDALVTWSHVPRLVSLTELTDQLSVVPGAPIFEMVSVPFCFAVSPWVAENEKLDGALPMEGAMPLPVNTTEAVWPVMPESDVDMAPPEVGAKATWKVQELAPPTGPSVVPEQVSLLSENADAPESESVPTVI